MLYYANIDNKRSLAYPYLILFYTHTFSKIIVFLIIIIIQT